VRAHQHQSFLTKLEAVASSAVRAADMASAKLLIVFTDTGLTASLVAKYRPSVPILTLVVPRLINENMQWKVLGRNVARQCQIIRGLVPMLAAPSPDGDRVLRDTIAAAAERGLLKAGDHAVCVEKISGDYCIKMIMVDDSGRDLQKPSLPEHSLTHSLTLRCH
jgi:pyruvate kinase